MLNPVPGLAGTPHGEAIEMTLLHSESHQFPSMSSQMSPGDRDGNQRVNVIQACHEPSDTSRGTLHPSEQLSVPASESGQAGQEANPIHTNINVNTVNRNNQMTEVQAVILDQEDSVSQTDELQSHDSDLLAPSDLQFHATDHNDSPYSENERSSNSSQDFPSTPPHPVESPLDSVGMDSNNPISTLSESIQPESSETASSNEHAHNDNHLTVETEIDISCPQCQSIQKVPKGTIVCMCNSCRKIISIGITACRDREGVRRMIPHSQSQVQVVTSPPSPPLEGAALAFEAQNPGKTMYCTSHVTHPGDIEETQIKTVLGERLAPLDQNIAEQYSDTSAGHCSEVYSNTSDNCSSNSPSPNDCVLPPPLSPSRRRVHEDSLREAQQVVNLTPQDIGPNQQNRNDHVPQTPIPATPDPILATNNNLMVPCITPIINNVSLYNTRPALPPLPALNRVNNVNNQAQNDNVREVYNIDPRVIDEDDPSPVNQAEVARAVAGWSSARPSGMRQGENEESHMDTSDESDQV